MRRRMKLPFLHNYKEITPRYSPWQWALCKQPKTVSFRAGDNVFKTVNSVFFDPNEDGFDTPKTSLFTSSSQYSASSSSTQSGDQDPRQGSAEEVILRGAQSKRLFFDPAGDSRSLLKDEEKVAAAAAASSGHQDKVLFRESSVVLAMESEDPYEDFKRSMEEMVESFGMRDWECLEELLGWYLKANGKRNHGFIVGAFVDLLVSMGEGPSSSSPASTSADSTCDDSTSFCSAYTSFSPPFSPPLMKEEIPGQKLR